MFLFLFCVFLIETILTLQCENLKEMCNKYKRTQSCFLYERNCDKTSTEHKNTPLKKNSTLIGQRPPISARRNYQVKLNSKKNVQSFADNLYFKFISENLGNSAHFLSVLTVGKGDMAKEMFPIFVNYMRGFIRPRLKTEYDITMLMQVDNNVPFNRAALINVGAAFSKGDYFLIQDVDLLPYNSVGLEFPEDNSVHALASTICHYKKRFYCEHMYQGYLGGAVLISKENFEKVNGLSNRFWGWGGEDDNFAARVSSHKINIARNTEKNVFYHIEGVSTVQKTSHEYYNANLKLLADYSTGYNETMVYIQEKKVLCKNHKGDIMALSNISLPAEDKPDLHIINVDFSTLFDNDSK